MKHNFFLYKDIYKDKTWFTISNILTFSRILLTPFIIIGVFYEKWNFVFILFLTVAITDLLDGYLARLFKQETNLGKFLDPIADKILIISFFSSLAFIHSPSFIIPYWFVIIVVCREFLILVGSFILIKLKITFKVAPTIWGKLTTFFQFLFIFWIFICYFFKWAPAKTYYVLLSLLAFFSLLTLLQYIKIGIKYLSNKI